MLELRLIGVHDDGENLVLESADGTRFLLPIDAMVDEMVTILDDAKRAEKCNEIEKKHMSEVCLFIPFLNGPDFKACRPKLANYGAFLFRSPDWSTVGWMA